MQIKKSVRGMKGAFLCQRLAFNFSVQVKWTKISAEAIPCLVNRYRCLPSSFDLCVRRLVPAVYFSPPAGVTSIAPGLYSL